MDDRVNGDGAADGIESGDEPAGADDEATAGGSVSISGGAPGQGVTENGDGPPETNGDGAAQTGDGEPAAAADSTLGIVPDAVDDGAAAVGGSVRPYLLSGERLAVQVRGTLLGETLRGDGVVGVTDGRLLAVTDDGEFAGVRLDRVCSVRSYPRTALDVEGVDYRALLAAGYLFAVVGFVGVLASAANPLAPVLALVALGGVMAVDFVRRETVEVDPAALADRIEAGALPDGLATGLRRFDRRREGRATDYQLALAGAGALAAVPFLGIVLVDASPLTPLFSLVTIGSVALVVHAFRNSEEFDGFELVRRRERTISVGLDDGTTVHVRTAPDAGLDQVLAGRVGSADAPESASA